LESRSGVLLFLLVFLRGFWEKWCFGMDFLWTACGELRGEGGFVKGAFLRVEIMQIS
jgi:hypothetical protein